MPSTPAAPAARPIVEPSQTVRIRPAIPAHLAPPETTDYELSASAVFPKSKSSFAMPIRFVDEKADRADTAPAASTATLDYDTRVAFHQRLRLCCVLGAVPIAIYSICAMTNFIEPFGRTVVGLPGAMLAVTVLVGLIATAIVMLRTQPYEGNTLRALELAVFGSMGLFFAYWQFVVLTSAPIRDQASAEASALKASPRPEDPPIVRPTDEAELRRLEAIRAMTKRYEQVHVLAITLVTHLNWVALIVFHGVLVPNSLLRGTVVGIAMAVVALAIDAATVVVSDPTRESADVLFAIGIPSLAAAAILGIFGTAKTARLREQVEEAKQMLRELGQYRLRKRLGAGGMGEVYLAEHHLLKRPCAVKRIHPKYLDKPDQIRRFEREVQATAKLRHPNTVEIYDYGRADDGTFYYVMEYLPGASLEEMVARFGPMPADRILHVLKQVCGALREAHRLQLIHRDIKPSNIILLHGGTPYDQVKLVDFGLVHSTNDEPNPDAKLTRDGLIVGTPEYMSPEQAQGLSLDPRSDLFSVGSVAYYLITGKEPFHRETAMKTLLAVVSDEPPPLADLNPFVPPDLATIVSKCLAKEPGQRFQSAYDLEQALMHCKAADLWTEDKATTWWATHPESDPGTGTDLASLPLRADRKE
jgi:serine/threonine-protein kinase